MAENRFARIAMWLDPSDSYGPWTKEMVDGVGLAAEWLDCAQLPTLADYDVLVIFGAAPTLPSILSKTIIEWLGTGGKHLLSCGTHFGLEPLLGLDAAPKRTSFGRGSLRKGDAPETLWPAGADEILFVGGMKATAHAGKTWATSTCGHAAIVRRGNATFFAPHLGQSLALIAGGRAVANDIIGPGDGTAETMHGQMRAEAGTNLRFDLDRKSFGEAAPVFSEPHLDHLRNLWAQTLLEATDSLGLRAAIAWHLPDNAPSAITCTVDCDTLSTDHVRKVAGSLLKFTTSATWLVPSPGFPQDIYRALDKWEHETGLLFKPEAGPLDEHVRVQYLQSMRSASRPVLTMRGQDCYWHGLTTLYEAAESAGAKVCATKGGVQPGTSGFLFGTSRPYFPVKRGGKSFNLVEAPFAICDPGIVTPLASIPHLVQQAHLSGGVLHFTIKTSSTQDIDFETGVTLTLTSALHWKMTQFTLEKLYHYERARRTLKWKVHEVGVTIATDVTIKNVTIMATGDDLQPESMGRKHNIVQMKRYGRIFTCATLDIDGRGQADLRFRPIELAA